jgi:hypothetical protein
MTHHPKLRITPGRDTAPGFFLTRRITTRGKRRMCVAMNLFPMSLLFY